jgi:transcriptional regulator NrdR family protein
MVLNLMKCPHCSATVIKVLATKHLDNLSIERYRTCSICNKSWHTKELQIIKKPKKVVILRDSKGKFISQKQNP